MARQRIERTEVERQKSELWLAEKVKGLDTRVEMRHGYEILIFMKKDDTEAVHPQTCLIVFEDTEKLKPTMTAEQFTRAAEWTVTKDHPAQVRADFYNRRESSAGVVPLDTFDAYCMGKSRILSPKKEPAPVKPQVVKMQPGKSLLIEPA